MKKNRNVSSVMKQLRYMTDDMEVLLAEATYVRDKVAVGRDKTLVGNMVKHLDDTTARLVALLNVYSGAVNASGPRNNIVTTTEERE